MRTKVLVLGCNYDQIPYLRILSNLYYVVGTDLNADAPGKIYCDIFYSVGYDNVDGILDVVKENKFTNSDLVFSAAAQFSHLTAALVAESLQIPYIQPDVVTWILDKTLFYNKFQEHNIQVPETKLIASERELEESLEEGRSYYLKSDFSKNPNYIYKITSNNVKQLNIFWGRDRYLRSHYVLQEEFVGEHLRINMVGERCYIFPLNQGHKTITSKQALENMGLINKLQILCSESGLERWVVKFDVVVSRKNYVLLDIGIDPPMRMKRSCESLNFPFFSEYIKLVLGEKYKEFPSA